MTGKLTDEDPIPLTELEVLKAELLAVNISPPEYKNQRAYKLIKKYFESGEVIPTELGTFLVDACDYQLDNLGNTVTNRITDNNWRSRVIDVEILRRCGYTVEKALEAIVNRDGNTYKESSLKAKRREYKEERKPKFINEAIYENLKLYGLDENNLADIILNIS